MTPDDRIRAQFGFGEKHDLPSRFWEPEPDEEDLKRIEEENLKRLEKEGSDWADEPLPFE